MHLRLVRGIHGEFGYLAEEIAEFEAIKTPTEAQIAGMIVDESDLTRLDRWRGQPAPGRWVPPAGLCLGASTCPNAGH